MLDPETKKNLNTCSGKIGDFDPHGTVIGAHNMEQRFIRGLE
jgi:hypothetical protein